MGFIIIKKLLVILLIFHLLFNYENKIFEQDLGSNVNNYVDSKEPQTEELKDDYQYNPEDYLEPLKKLLLENPP
jgi:hypothetical protein